MINRRRLLSTTAATALGAALSGTAVPCARAAERAQGAADAVRVAGPGVEYVHHPLGLDTPRPRLSWPLTSDRPGHRQSAYRLRVATDPGRLAEPDVWDSGKATSGRSVLVPYAGPPLVSRTRYFWSVRVRDADGSASGWSAPSWWKTGLLEAADWSARWIGAPAALTGAPALDDASWIWFPEGDPANSAPAATRWFRGRADVPPGVTRARLVLTADDGFTAHVNAVEVARTEADGPARNWSRPVLVDVVSHLRPGTNVIAVSATNAETGPAGLLGVLELTTADGVRTLPTGADWRTADREPTGDWRSAGYDDTSWSTAAVLAPWGSGPWGKVPVAHSPARRLRQEFRLGRGTVARARLYSTALGLYEAYLNGDRVGEDRLAPGWTGYRKRVQYQTYDVTALLRPGGNALGVTLAAGWYAGSIGWFGPHQYGEQPAVLAQLEITYTGGTSERVVSDTGWRAAAGPVTEADLMAGEVYDARLETDGWRGTERYEPRFTFHGFRYVKVTGYPGRPSRDAVVGRVIHTAAPFTMDFSTNVPLLNQLHSNITWGQRGNFVSIPTDTPARDERLGWTGDINVFAPTAAYTMESARFLTKWLQDLRDDQAADGAFPDVAPLVGPVGKGVAGWGDAGVTVPWALYRAYGDVRVLEQSWASMVKWLDYLTTHSTGLLRPDEGYGDWLNIQDETPKDVIGTAYFAHSADLVARTAEVPGKDPEPYRALFGRVRDAFRAAYVSAGGRVKGDTQTAYVLALSMDLLTATDRAPAADRLVALIEAKDWHLSTGFLGTPRLLPVLTATGHTDVAYRLLTQRTFPSWGYQIGRGATTMWERWDSIRPDGSFQDAGMNSFNHYAYGSVGEWMYASIAGIAPGAPGFRKIVVRPRPGGGVTEAQGRFDSLYGPVTTRWSTGRKGFSLRVSFPANTAHPPPAGGGCAVFAAGSGTHHFTAT